MQLDKKIEGLIKNKALKLLVSGRPNWDKKHTLSTVKWMRELINKEGGNERILIPAMYLHDTGYEQLPKGYSHKFMLKNKRKWDHGKAGASIAEKFLPKLNYFSDNEINKICFLIENHNKHDNINEKDRQLVFEADSFGQIDYENCPPNYDYENLKIFLNTTFKERTGLIKTKTGKKILKELLPKAKKYLSILKKNK